MIIISHTSMKSILAFILILALSFAPSVYAQELTAGAPSTEVPASAEEPVAVREETPVPAMPEVSASDPVPMTLVSEPGFPAGADTSTSTPIQDTANTQDTVDAGLLQGASNPEDLATTTVTVDSKEASSTPLTLEASSTPESLPLDESTTLDVVAEDVQPADATEPELVAESAPAPEPETLRPEPISVADLAPKPEYSFSMTGKRVDAKRVVRDQSGKERLTDVAQTLSPEIDNTTGVMQVSGTCSNTYFVILLFKNQDDYLRDPKSYIVDKAFPCVNGSFTYRIADLPDALPGGTYYLLVGEEGERGPWAAITDLTEVTINRNH